MDREPLSVRRGLNEPDHGPFEGMPGHLEHACQLWVRHALHDPSDPWSESVASLVATRLRVVVDHVGVLSSILEACDERGSDFLLDVIDQTLWQTHGRTAEDLEVLLYNGSSVWTVSEDGRSLVRRVTETERQAYETSVSAADQVAEELRTAWRATYGRHPDPSDAWDHAIKAVELALCPIVIPKNPIKTLGVVIRDLKNAKEGKYEVRLGDLATFIAMLELIWPNPDRHGGASPSLEAATTAVHTAIHIVGLARRNDFKRSDDPIAA